MASCLKTITQCWAPKSKADHVDELVYNLGKMFKKSSAAEASGYLSPASPIYAGALSPLKPADVYSVLTERNKICFKRAKRAFKKCLVEGDVDDLEVVEGVDVKAILDPTGHQKLAWVDYTEDHYQYINDQGWSLGFPRLMRLIFDHLMQPNETIGVPDEAMQMFMRVSKEISGDYEDATKLYNLGHGNKFIKELIYIEYYSKVLDLMIRVEVDAPENA